MEVESLLEKVLFLEPAQGIPDRPGRQIRLIYDLFLGHEAARLQHLDDKFGGWRQAV